MSRPERHTRGGTSRILAVVLLVCAVTAAPADAQKDKKKKGPKVDSLLIVTAQDRQDALDATVAAFEANGLPVTNTTTSMVESDLGKKGGMFNVFERKVRALVLGSSSGRTTLLVVGDETLDPDRNPLRYRIDNRAHGEGGRIWKKMVAVADALGSPLADTSLDTRTPAMSEGPPVGGRASSSAAGRDDQRRSTLAALKELRVVESATQMSPRIVRVSVGDGYYDIDQAARDNHFKRLYEAYVSGADPLYLELWDRGTKFGEYSNGSFYVGPRFSAPR